MMYSKSFSAIFLLISLLVLSCGKKENDQEYIDDRPVNTQTDKPEKKVEPLQNVTKPDSNSTKNPQTDNSKEKPQVNYERSYHPVASVSALEAGDYVGKDLTVTGLVADVYKNDKVAYLNFVQKYPQNPFTAVIFSNKFSEFKDIDKYELKNVEVTGRVSSFKGKPQIILDSPSQIKVVK
jgi:DNA/RNA endonuclease YhcR with UshA esterase domain